MLDVAAPEAHQNDSSYVSELSGPTFNPLHKNLAGWAVTRRTSRNHKTVKIGGWVLASRWALTRDNTVVKELCTTEMLCLDRISKQV